MRTTDTHHQLTTRPVTDYTTRPLVQDQRSNGQQAGCQAGMSNEIKERLAWVHREASELTATDLVELKFALKRLVDDAIRLQALVRDELQMQRRQQGKAHV